MKQFDGFLPRQPIDYRYFIYMPISNSGNPDPHNPVVSGKLEHKKLQKKQVTPRKESPRKKDPQKENPHKRDLQEEIPSLTPHI